MKITEKDLDPGIIARLRALDPIINTFDFEKKKPAFVSFDGKKFTNKYFDTLLLDEVSSDEEINKLLASIGDISQNSLIETNLNTPLNLNNVKSANFKSMATNQEILAEIKLKSKILKIKYIQDNKVLLFTENGNVYKIDLVSRKALMSFNLVSSIRTKFATKEFYNHDVLDCQEYKDGLIISTINNGIYFINSKLEIKNIIPESGISRMEVFGNKLFCMIPRMEKNILVYNLDDGTKVETHNQLVRLRQIPVRMKRFGKKVFVLGRNLDRHDSTKILHCWIEDEAGISFNNIDFRFQPLKHDFHVLPRFIEIDDQYLYLIGFKRKEIIMYKFQLMQLSKTPEIKHFSLKGADFSNASSIDVYNGNLLIAFNNVVLESSGIDKIEKIILFKTSEIDGLKRIGDRLFFFSDENLYEAVNPEYTNLQSFMVTILKGNKPCNNISFFLKVSNPSTFKFTIVDENAKIITPDLIIVRDEGIFVKIENNPSSNIFLKLSPKQDDNIEGIAISKNQVYYREVE